MSITDSDLIEHLRKGLTGQAFVPYSFVDKSSDSLTVYTSGEADYSEQIHAHLSLYRSLETNQVVGFRIDGLHNLLDGIPAGMKLIEFQTKDQPDA